MTLGVAKWRGSGLETTLIKKRCTRLSTDFIEKNSRTVVSLCMGMFNFGVVRVADNFRIRAEKRFLNAYWHITRHTRRCLNVISA